MDDEEERLGVSLNEACRAEWTRRRKGLTSRFET